MRRAPGDDDLGPEDLDGVRTADRPLVEGIQGLANVLVKVGSSLGHPPDKFQRDAFVALM